MSSETDGPRTLREMELEVEAEGREWMRHRLEEKLQAEVNRHGGVFPPKRTQGVAPPAADDAPANRLRGRRPGGVARGRCGCWSVGLSDTSVVGFKFAPTTQSGLGRQAGAFYHRDRFVCGGGEAGRQSGLSGGRLDDPVKAYNSVPQRLSHQ
jgi:hypothetical protein